MLTINSTMLASSYVTDLENSRYGSLLSHYGGGGGLLSLNGLICSLVLSHDIATPYRSFRGLVQTTRGHKEDLNER